VSKSSVSKYRRKKPNGRKPPVAYLAADGGGRLGRPIILSTGKGNTRITGEEARQLAIQLYELFKQIYQSRKEIECQEP
jgi:hypothetical protein